jgi:hypothetical protein
MISYTKTAFGATADALGYLNEPLRRLQWLRQELDHWDAAGGRGFMPQPRQYGIRLADLRPSEIYWRAAP